MREISKDLDSTTYRKLFELAEKEGPEIVINFINEYKELLSEDSLTKAILQGKHDTLAFTKNHKAMTEFLRELKCEKTPHFLIDMNFPRFARSLTEENVKTYLEGAKALEDLNIQRVTILGRNNEILCYQTIIYYDADHIESICKQYSNGFISYQHIPEATNGKSELYRSSIHFPNNATRLAINTENQKDGTTYKTADLSDFGFDIKTLPTLEELESYKPPKSLEQDKVYVKR